MDKKLEELREAVFATERAGEDALRVKKDAFRAWDDAFCAWEDAYRAWDDADRALRKYEEEHSDE